MHKTFEEFYELREARKRMANGGSTATGGHSTASNGNGGSESSKSGEGVTSDSEAAAEPTEDDAELSDDEEDQEEDKGGTTTKDVATYLGAIWRPLSTGKKAKKGKKKCKYGRLPNGKCQKR